MRRFFSLVIATLVATFSFSASAAVLQLIGANWQTGQLFDINKSNAQTSNPRSMAFVNPIGIATGPNGRLFSITPGFNPSTQLYEVDPASGASIDIGALGLGFIAEGDLAFNPTGTLYGLADSLNGPSNGLFTVNTATGAATLVGGMPTSADDTSGMIFTSSGTLYVLDTRSNAGGPALLYTVNPSNASITHTTTLSVTFPAFTALAGMTIDPSTGTMYIATNTSVLYTVDPTTGLMTSLGSMGTIGFQTSGLAFATVPEPAGAAWAIGIAAWLRKSRRRSVG